MSDTVNANVRITTTDDSAAGWQSYVNNLKSSVNSSKQIIDQGLTQQFKKSGAAVEELTPKVRRGAADMASALGGVNIVGNVLTGTMQGLAGAIGTAGVVAAMQKSFTTFATAARHMDVLGASGKYTKDQLKELNRVIPEVATVLGALPEDTSKKFDAFFASVKLPFNEAVKVFQETSKWVAVTGGDIDKASIAAAGALNNLHVSVEDIPKVFAAWRLLIPPAMIGPFSQGAETITKRWEALEMRGADHAIALGAIYSNPKLKAEEFNTILKNIEERGSNLGSAMAPAMEQIKKDMGGPLEVMEALYQRVLAMGAYKNPVQGADIAKELGFGTDFLLVLKETHENLGTLKTRIDDAKRAMSNAEVLEGFNKALESLHKLAVATMKAFEAMGGMLNSLHVPEGLTKIAEELEKISRWLDNINAKGLKKALEESDLVKITPGSVADSARKYMAPGNEQEKSESRAPFERYKTEPWYKSLLPKFAAGTSYVPDDMVAQIHKGEQIIPAGANRSSFDAQKSERLTEKNTATIVENTYALINLTEAVKPGAGGTNAFGGSRTNMPGGLGDPAGGGGGAGVSRPGSSPMGGSAGGGLPSGNRMENAQRMYNELRKLGHSHEQASAALGHVQAESGFNPNATGDAGTAHGFFQHRGSRWADAQNQAAETGDDPRSPEAAARHFDRELRTKEKAAGGKYFGSTSTKDAVTALNQYERFRGWQQGQSSRYSNAEGFAGTMKEGGGGTSESSRVGGGEGGGSVNELQSRVAGTRRGALDPRLRSALDYASEQTGLSVDVTSGGQRMHGAPGAVGSHRHDGGRAGDFNLKDEKGNIVSPNDPRALEFYRHAGRGGVTGGGAGYMSDPNKIHLDIDSDNNRSPIYAGSSAFRKSLQQGKNERPAFLQQQKEKATTQSNSSNKLSGMDDMEQTVKIKYDVPSQQTARLRERTASLANRTHRNSRDYLANYETQYAQADIGSRTV